MIKKGDKVKIKEGYYKAMSNRESTFTVDTKPFKVNGIQSVCLKGQRGVYAVEALECV